MKRSDAFAGKYVKASDLNGRDHIMTIDRVVREMVGTGDKREEKTVCHFVGNRLMPMVINSTKWDALELIAGTDDSDEWVGLSIMLSVGRTTFQGRSVACIVVKPAPKPKKPAQPDPDIDDDENPAVGMEAEEVPF